MMLCIVSLLISLCVLPSPVPAEKGSPDRAAYVNVARVLTECTEAIEARATMEKEIMEWRRAADKKYSEIVEMEKDLATQQLMLNDESRAASEEEIQKKKIELEAYLQEFQAPGGKITTREAELLKPIEQKILALLDDIAKEKELTMVLDSSAGVLIWAKDEMDITDIVIERLNSESSSEESK